MKKLIGLALMLGAIAVAVRAEEKTVGTSASFKGPVGLQLWSLRDSFKKDVPGTLDLVKKMGFKYVELAGTYGKSPEEFRKDLDSRGLVAIAGHFGFERLEKDPEGVANDAATLGLRYAGCAWIPHKDPFDEAQCRHAADVFNKAGAALAKRGLKFYYHTHGYEFQPHGDGTLFDMLVQGTDPKTVSYEMDVTWVVFPGQDPAKLLQKYGSRFELMHMKDLKKGVQGNLSGGTDQNNDVVLGTGQADWKSIFIAAQAAGTKWYFIEDESSRAVEQIPESLKYLEQISL